MKEEEHKEEEKERKKKNQNRNVALLAQSFSRTRMQLFH